MNSEHTFTIRITNNVLGGFDDQVFTAVNRKVNPVISSKYSSSLF